MKRQIEAEDPKPVKKRKIEEGDTSRAVSTDKGTFASPQINIVSWNVNGLRSAEKKPGFQEFVKQDFDIFCLNETKLQDTNTQDCEASFSEYPYKYWNCSQAKKGYSGTALFSKIEPISVTNGIGQRKHDDEGRCITAEYDSFYVVSTYIPNAGTGGKLGRLDYRTKEWDVDFRAYLKGLESNGKSVIWLGDLNVIHHDIDIWDTANKPKQAGCTPAERKGFGEFLAAGFVDSFRNLYSTKAQYSWYSAMNKAAREQNKGWRLDYIVVSEGLMPRVNDSIIHDTVTGSDHTPIQLVLNNS